MITSAITVGSNGSIVLSSGATYGILLAILFCHGLVCSAATNVLARLNLFYVIVNGMSNLPLEGALPMMNNESRGYYCGCDRCFARGLW